MSTSKRSSPPPSPAFLHRHKRARHSPSPPAASTARSSTSTSTDLFAIAARIRADRRERDEYLERQHLADLAAEDGSEWRSAGVGAFGAGSGAMDDMDEEEYTEFVRTSSTASHDRDRGKERGYEKTAEEREAKRHRRAWKRYMRRWDQVVSLSALLKQERGREEEGQRKRWWDLPWPLASLLSSSTSTSHRERADRPSNLIGPSLPAPRHHPPSSRHNEQQEEEITPPAIANFLFCHPSISSASSSSDVKRAKENLLRATIRAYHPDRSAATLLAVADPTDRDRVQTMILAVSQGLNSLLEQVRNGTA
ncbi:uncharacterized protein PFL1_02350 [Pseudozyma flocculosa PF-1]|uniref:uncharacterized protein n=1 Tax=Pseudozyma flocculosa PF-1 TaxID=1277687 RepID=UPI000456012C|nr:uncharacterized protein PFL1_02350 [Pseudozyma flocculosa PF-1]EPQ30234.1 hypothetical protein PFL1_02350 [Pseudozyma flocculosa PF-1]